MWKEQAREQEAAGSQRDARGSRAPRSCWRVPGTGKDMQDSRTCPFGFTH